MQTKFEVGDQVKQLENCSGARAGEIYTLIEYEGYLYTSVNGKNTNCSHHQKWELISKSKEDISYAK